MNLSDFISLTPKQSIGGITIQATVEEVYTDDLMVTEHPVELGAAITDHAYKLPSEVIIRCGWSNSNLDALIGLAQAVIEGGSLVNSDYVSGVYSQLLALQESRVPFDLTTTKRQYQNMLIRSLGVTTDKNSSNALMVTAVCRQIIIVQTQATTMPPKANQAKAASTAGTQNTGTKQAVAASPSPGGSLPVGG